MADTSRYFGIGLDVSKLIKDAEKAKAAFDSIGEEALKQGKAIDNAFKGISSKEFQKFREGFGAGLSDQIAGTIKSLETQGVQLFGSLSKEAQGYIAKMQESQAALSNVDKYQSALNEAYEEGRISLQDYTQASARMYVLREEITKSLAENEQALKRNTVQMDVAEDSIVSMQAKVALLTTEYMKLGEVQRNSAQGEGLLKQMSDLQTKLNAAQASMQRFGGAATAQFNMIGMSMQQIVRELPSLAMSPQMFFLAISNNLPVFTDAFAQARKEYQLLTAAGKSATPVWKQVVSSLLSWQTALSALPAILIVLGPKIAEFFQSFLTGREKILSATDALKNINKELESSNANYGENVVTLKSLSEEWKSLTDEASKTEWINENQSEFDKLEISINDVGDAERAFVDNTDDIIEAFKLRAQAAAAQELASEKYKEAMIKQREAELEAEKAIAQRTSNDIPWWYGQGNTQNPYNRKSSQQINEEIARGIEKNVKKMEEESEAIRETADSYFDLYKAKEQEANSKLKDIGIERNVDSQEEDKKSLSKLKGYLNEVEQLRQDNEDRQVSLLEEGTEKQLAEINLRYDRELEAVRKLRTELEKAQGGKLTEEQTSIFDAAVTGIEDGRKRDTNSLLSKQFEEEKEAMNRYLAEYGTYLEKRQAITEQYQEKIDSTTNDWDKKYFEAQRTEALAKLDDEVQKKTSIITRLFGDMSKKSVEEMRSIADEAQSMLDYINAGEYKTDENGKGLFGITKEQFDVLSKSPEKLESIKKGIKDVQDEADDAEVELRSISDILKGIFSTTGKDDLEKLFEQLNEKVGKVLKSAQFLSNVFSSLGDAFGSDALTGIAEGINVAVDSISSSMQGMEFGKSIADIGQQLGIVGQQAASMFGPIGMAAGAAIGVVSSLASAIAKIHDKKNEKRIQDLQDQIDTLSSSYDKLGNEIEKAYSKSAQKLIEDSNKVLEQQIMLMEMQIREEEEKKKTDEERIKQWREEIDSMKQVIEDNKEAASDAIYGEDIQSAISNFVDAYTQAWDGVGDRASAAKDTVKQMMQNMVTESIKDMIKTSKSMDQIRDKLKEFYADNIFSDWEQNYIYNMAEDLQKELDKQFGWADSLFKSEENNESSSSQSASRGYSVTASQESIDETNGRLTGIQMGVEEIKSQISIGNVNLEAIKTNVADFKDIMTNCFNELSEINANTGAIVKPIQTMQADIAEMKNDIKNKM